MLAVWNQQKRIIRSRDHIFPLIKYKPFEGTNFTNGLDNSNKKFNVGKSWYIDMLRRKSNSDLEKLWYSLLREKLAIQSDKYSLTQKNLRIRDEVRTAYSKVCVSMSRIKSVVGEREQINNEFNMLLEYWYIRNKQMSNNKFEITKTIKDWAKKKNYIRMPIEEPKDKNKLIKELKLLDREKDIQLKKTQKAVILEKKKEINLLKAEIQEKVMNNYLEEEIKLKKLRQRNVPNPKVELENLNKTLKEQKEKRAQITDSEIRKDITKSIRKLAAKIQKLRSTLQTEKANKEEKKKPNKPNETKDKTEQEVITNDKKKNPKLTHEKNESISENIKEEKSASDSINSSEVVSFKKNSKTKNQSTEIQKLKAKRSRKSASISNEESPEDNKSTEEMATQKNIFNAFPQPETKKKVDIESFKQSLTRKKRKEIREKIKKTLRGKVTRLGVKYRAVLADHKKITLNKIVPYKRRLCDEIKNLNDIKKVGIEYKIPKPKLIEPIIINTTDKKYEDILLGRVKAPVPYMKKDDSSKRKSITVLSRKEISQAKSLIQRKNRRQILSQYVSNTKMISHKGKINAYNKIMKIRSRQAKDIFLKELSALKHHLKHQDSFYNKFKNNQSDENKK